MSGYDSDMPSSSAKRRAPNPPVAKAVRKYVNRRINARMEEKAVTFESLAVDASYDAPTIGQLNNIPEGTGDDERVGDELRYKQLSIKGSFQTQANSNTIARFLVFQWYHNTTPAISDVLVTPTGSNANYVNAPYVRDNLHRMKILYDKRFALAAANSTSGLKLTEQFSVFINETDWGRRVVNYIAASSTNSTNTLYYLALSNVTDASAAEPVLNMAGFLSWTE